MSIDRVIWNKFRVKRGDNIPYCGWGATRDLMTELFAELGYKRGAEIGVCQGLYSELLCQKIPGLELIGVDTWTHNRLRSQVKQEANFEEAKKRLAPFNVTLIRKASAEAVRDIPDNSLDFVYIDGDHEFEPAMHDIIHWAHKVRVGGIVSGHDYCWGYKSGVVAAVDAYVRGMGIQSWYLTSRDKEPSWLWVKR